MRPQRRARMAGSTAWVHRNADLRLTAMVRSNSASVRSSSPRRRAMPALLMSTSGRPSSRAMALQHALDGGAVGDIGAHGRRPPAEPADRLRDGVCFRRARRVVHGHVGAGFSESERNSPADAPRAAGDEGDAAGEVGGSGHKQLLPDHMEDNATRAPERDHSGQLRSRTRSSFLLRIQERPRKAISMTRPRLEEASLMTFSETWPKA